MNTYMAVIKDYTDNPRGLIVGIMAQPRPFLGKDFLRDVAGFMWREFYGASRDRDMCADIYVNDTLVATMGCAYLARNQRVHTTICGKYPSDPCTFRAFNLPTRSVDELIVSYYGREK